MALREEFEYISYFCYKCSVYNASRKEISTKTSTMPFNLDLGNKINEPSSSLFPYASLQERPASAIESIKEESSAGSTNEGQLSPRDTGADTDGFERVSDAESES